MAAGVSPRGAGTGELPVSLLSRCRPLRGKGLKPAGPSEGERPRGARGGKAWNPWRPHRGRGLEPVDSPARVLCGLPRLEPGAAWWPQWLWHHSRDISSSAQDRVPVGAATKLHTLMVCTAGCVRSRGQRNRFSLVQNRKNNFIS